MSTENIIFNVIDWRETNNVLTEENEEIENDDMYQGRDEVQPEVAGKYSIELFGRTEDDKSVYVKVNDFTPYFYVEIPNEWGDKHVNKFVEYIKFRSIRKFRDSLIEYDIVKRHKFYGFTDNKEFKFIRLIFSNSEAMRKYSFIFYNEMQIPGLTSNKIKFKIYESNIVPLLRCMHIRDIKSCGWIGVDQYYEIEDDSILTDIKIEACWMDLKPIDKNIYADLKILSFDIECTSIDGGFPIAKREGDKIIMIGSTLSRYGKQQCFHKNIIVLGSCDPIPGVEVECYNNEKDVLLAWAKLVRRTDPDIITGYNIFGFDEIYIRDRAKLLGISNEFSRLGRFSDEISDFMETDLSSSALGDNKMRYFDMKGRVQIDLLKVVQRDHKLSSYKLDSVAENFIKGNISACINRNTIKCDNMDVLSVGNYITLEEDEVKYLDGKKFRIINIDKNIITLDSDLNIDLKKNKFKWGLVKDDLHPRELFKLFKGSSADRKIIAEYCIQDCALCNRLLAKLEILTNNMAMAIVCNVPLSYIFLRGQGIKIFSLVAKKCRTENYIIPVIRKNNNNVEEEEDSYQGAVVFDPKPGHYQTPIPVTDYGSLYPSSMIHKNLSHETIVLNGIYDNLPNYTYYDVNYETTNGKKMTCRYAKNKNGKMGILPQILQQLLAERKATRKKQEDEKDPSKWAILEGLQLAFKVTANSLYGQCGASTSPICLKEIAASTTAIGRDMLEFCKLFIEKIYREVIKIYLTMEMDEDKFKKMVGSILDNCKKSYISKDESFLIDYLKDLFNKMAPYQQFIEDNDIETNVETIYSDKYILPFLIQYAEENNIKFNVRKDGEDDSKFNKRIKNELYPQYTLLLRAMVHKYLSEKNIDLEPEIIYGDTDSNFINMRVYDKVTRENIKGIDSLSICIELGKLASNFISPLLPPPHTLNYEKTLWPFCIMSKKRYVGNMYEMDPHHYHLKYMGIVLKRRDNANIVKKIISGIINIMMSEPDQQKITEFIRKSIEDLLSGKYPIEDFIVTKTLKANYKDRTKIAHVCLADKRAIRDPGNKPQLNDRIPYVYKETKPIKGKKYLQGDLVEDPDYVRENGLKIDYLFYLTNQIMNPALQLLEFVVKNPEKMFNDYIQKEMNKRNGVQEISKWFPKNKESNDSDPYDKESNDSDSDDHPKFEPPIPKIKSKFLPDL